MLPIFAIKPPTPVQAAALIRRPNLGRQADFPKVGEFACVRITAVQGYDFEAVPL